MAQIEFLEPEAEPTAPARPRRPPIGRRPLVSAAALVTAAALAITTPFLNIYRIHGLGPSGTVETRDSWGRDTVSGYPALGAGGFHGPRIGIVFCVAAGLALIAAALPLVRPLGRTFPAVTDLLRATVFGLTAALAAVAALTWSSVRDSALAEASEPSDDGARRHVHVDLGPGVWLAVATAVVALLALAAARLAARRPDPDEPPEERPHEPLGEHQEDSVP